MIRQKSEKKCILKDFGTFRAYFWYNIHAMKSEKFDFGAMLDEQLKSEIEEQLPTDIPHVFISSFTQEGIKELKDMLWIALQKETPAEEEPVVLFPGDDNEIKL